MSVGGKDSRDAILGGPLAATLFGLAWPMTATAALDQSQNFLVALWAGRLIGGDSLAALAVMNPVLMLVMLATGTIHVGVQVLVARSTGRGDGEGPTLLANALYLGLAWAGAITVLGLVQLDDLAGALAGELTIRSSLVDYFTPWLCFFFASVTGGVVMFAVNATGWTRFALGRSIVSLVFMLALMPVLIRVFDLGLVGVSLSDGCSDVLLLVLAGIALYAARDTVELFPKREQWRLDLAAWRRIVAAGLPYQLARAMSAVTAVAMIRVVMQSGDPDLVAGYGLTILVMAMIGGLIGGSIAPAAGIVIGQNAGAGNIDRAIACLRLAAIWLAVCGAVVIVLGSHFEPLFGLFTDDEVTIRRADEVTTMLKWAAPGSLVSGLLLRANAAIAKNRVGNVVWIACSILALVATLALPGPEVERVVWITVVTAYVQLVAMFGLVLRSLRAARAK